MEISPNTTGKHIKYVNNKKGHFDPQETRGLREFRSQVGQGAEEAWDVEQSEGGWGDANEMSSVKNNLI